MDIQDDPLGLGPPERGNFDWLVPEAEDGAESRRPTGAQQPVWCPVTPPCNKRAVRLNSCFMFQHVAPAAA